MFELLGQGRGTRSGAFGLLVLVAALEVDVKRVVSPDWEGGGETACEECVQP